MFPSIFPEHNNSSGERKVFNYFNNYNNINMLFNNNSNINHKTIRKNRKEL